MAVGSIFGASSAVRAPNARACSIVLCRRVRRVFPSVSTRKGREPEGTTGDQGFCSAISSMVGLESVSISRSPVTFKAVKLTSPQHRNLPVPHSRHRTQIPQREVFFRCLKPNSVPCFQKPTCQNQSLHHRRSVACAFSKVRTQTRIPMKAANKPSQNQLPLRFG